MRVTLLTLSLLMAGSCADPERIDPPTVRVLFGVGGLNDGSLNDGVAAGVVFAQAGTSFELETFEPESAAGASAKLDEWLAAAGARDLIVLATGAYGPLVEALDCDFGGTRILLVDGSAETCPALRSVSFRSFAPAYLGGVAAVSDPTIAPRGRVAMIGGAELRAVRELLDGFRAGVEVTGGEVVEELIVSDDPAVGFSDPAAAAALAEPLLEEVDVIFVAAGRSGQGVAELLQARARRDPRGPSRVWLVGSDTDQSVSYGLVTLASVLKRFDAVVRDAILEMVAGDLTSGDVEVGFRDRMTELLLHPRQGARVLGGSCDDCDPFTPGCYQGCTTLEDVIRDAEAVAAEAASEWRAR